MQGPNSQNALDCFRQLAGVPNPVAILKTITCLEYHSCEHADWATNQARQFCHELRDRCADRLPAYEQA